MSYHRDLRRQLAEKYLYQRFLSYGAVLQLQKQPPANFTETIAASLTVGCVRLNAVLYPSYSSILLGYDVFVKDAPDAEEWIFYDSLPDTVSLKESAMLRILDDFVVLQNLSYTDSCFARLAGKAPQKP